MQSRRKRVLLWTKKRDKGKNGQNKILKSELVSKSGRDILS